MLVAPSPVVFEKRRLCSQLRCNVRTQEVTTTLQLKYLTIRFILERCLQMTLIMEKLHALDCHFTWITKEHLANQSVTVLLEYLVSDIKKEWNKTAVFARPFIAFLLTQLDNPNLDRASEEVAKAIELCDDSSSETDCNRRQGYKLVALSNKAYIQNTMGDTDGLKETLKEIDFLTSKKNDNDKMNACVLGMEGFALSHVGNSYTAAGLVLFRTAEDLDPDNVEWPLSRGLLAGRLLKWEKRLGKMGTNFGSAVLDQLEAEQEESLLRAAELSDDTECIPMLHLADLYYYRGRGQPFFRWTQNQKLMEKAKKLYLKVYDINPDCTALLKRIGKAFPEMDVTEEPFAEECLLRAKELDPENSMLLHRLGQYYEHCKGPKYNLPKAEEYYQKAILCGPARNLAADMDLGRVRTKMNRDYDFKQHLIDLLEVHPDEVDQLTIQNRLLHVRY